MRAGVGFPSVWGDLRNQIFLGGETFIANLQAGISFEPSLEEIPSIQRWPLSKPLASYKEEPQDNPHRGMALAYLSGDYTMKATADEFGVHYTTVNRAVKTYELELAQSG